MRSFCSSNEQRNGIDDPILLAFLLNRKDAKIFHLSSLSNVRFARFPSEPSDEKSEIKDDERGRYPSFNAT